MDKSSPLPAELLCPRQRSLPQTRSISLTAFLAATGFAILLAAQHILRTATPLPRPRLATSPFGHFPLPNDPFQFIPCTAAYSLPPLNDSDPSRTWAGLFDPDPAHWRWGSASPSPKPSGVVHDDPYAGRGIHLCGYLDLPLDHRNVSDLRITRIAVAKFQVSGLVRVETHPGPHGQPPLISAKSERTIVVEPGGPGESGVEHVWAWAENLTKRFSNGRFDILGWDPRGVHHSLPRAACFPHNGYRDRWSLLAGRYLEESNPTQQLRLADAMNNATFYACQKRLGDFGRFVSTASVARDLEAIREALAEEELTAYFVSYGTGIGQTYANMFPDRVGRVILDGCQHIRDQQQLAGFAWASLDNVTDAWREGFLGECVKAGPDKCALAKGPTSTVQELETRMDKLLASVLAQPLSGYTPVEGPSLITYSNLLPIIYSSLYSPWKWRSTARMLAELEMGNSTLTAIALGEPLPCSAKQPSSAELTSLVICADSYDAPQPSGGLEWWGQLWANMTDRSWISGNLRFLHVLPCRHFTQYWPRVSEVYRGPLNYTLRNPVLLIAPTHDPATPLRNAKRLLQDMGQNARLVIHHGYGHTSRFHRSNCTDSIGKSLILNGRLPTQRETTCTADKNPYQF